ncbi:aminotransferase class I/II-fold pyridoxal phosphate-dependent enzyme [Jeotgalibacillus sp. R-1-5s-1]|uniref:aminotransferase class I/II-fold pyridoxal phosphate-dependent enzyme n=1 Tax=Jeotgalibacillus sp. R-1-5s-1 TaxID=2555897 RepID=UPI0010699D6E|nr:aminotransferase class I/II-fold pyridoxal phosphate-dependent enzyme [Jeotgalibacillus sp. R-1-5s-1]TFE01899.1 aminotransferase class I/II-fold pyridoxal phosphate-dependent enzyme [Jeotgalibacillus sp. R-1-5s-1]
MNHSNQPLVEALAAHQNRHPVSFHVPGHKNGSVADQAFGQLLGWDQTELTGLDDLHAPEEVIRDAQALLCDYYQSKQSYFLVNGSTVGNLAMILASCRAGDRVFVARNAHKSVMNACSLAQVKPVYLMPDVHAESQTPSGISPDRLRQAVQTYPDVKVIVLTYPSYYGHTGQMAELVKVAKEAGLTVLVDEAHGAHFSLPGFPESSLAFGADVVVQSAHKTLPAMTMGSFLHVNSEVVSVAKVERYLGMLQSSSPSYPIMASLDMARSYVATYSEKDAAHFHEVRSAFIERLRQITDVSVIEAEDPLKLMIRVAGLDGYRLQKRYEAHGIFSELADPLQVLWMLPLLKEGQLYEAELDRAVEALKNITAEKMDGPAVKQLVLEEEPFFEPAFTIDEAVDLAVEMVDLDHVTGRLAAESVIPYPPGIPFILPGERMTGRKVQQLRDIVQSEMRFQGGAFLIEGKLKVVQEDNDE